MTDDDAINSNSNRGRPGRRRAGGRSWRRRGFRWSRRLTGRAGDPSTTSGLSGTKKEHVGTSATDVVSRGAPAPPSPSCRWFWRHWQPMRASLLRGQPFRVSVSRAPHYEPMKSHTLVLEGYYILLHLRFSLVDRFSFQAERPSDGSSSLSARLPLYGTATLLRTWKQFLFILK